MVNEYEVVGVVITLVGFLAMILPPIINLTKSITKLTTVVEGLSSDMEEQRKQGIESHRRLWEHNEEQDEKISNHEARIAVLEKTES